MFIIEHGRPRLTELDRESALSQLTTNTDDAYGFPPFRYLAPAISIGGLDYPQLRQTEQEIMASFLRHVRIRVLASDHFSWADDIPRILSQDALPRPGSPEARAPADPCAEAWPRWDTEPAYGRAR